MKFLCDRQQLQEAFGIVAGVVPAKTPKPIVQNVLARAEKDGLTLFATDFELSARVHLDAVKVTKAGNALLPARETAALLREITDPTVSFSTKDQRTTLESGGGSFVLLGDDPEKFPREVELKGSKSVELPAGRFVEMIQRTAFAAAREETRYAINGALLECKDGTLRLVATDGRRLALTYASLAGKTPAVKEVVPLRALQAILRAIPEQSEETLEILFGERQVGLKLGSTLLVSQLLEANFPEYEGVIPKAADTSVDLSRDLLAANLRRVAILASNDVRMVRLNFTASTLEMAAENSSVGRAEVVMEADVKGAGGAVSFNPDYLLDALKVAERDVVRLDMTDESTPVKFTLGEAFTYVLMPISGS
jgi:DNA polymerase-3 subunit beta